MQRSPLALTLAVAALAATADVRGRPHRDRLEAQPEARQAGQAGQARRSPSAASTAPTTCADHRAAGRDHQQTDKKWVCAGPQDGTVVNVSILTNAVDAVHLNAGCTGSIVVHIYTTQNDGIKIHQGAHDLQITGDITCDGKTGAIHQDGIQAMGGRDVLIGSTTQDGAMTIDCPTGNNGGVFVNAGLGTGMKSDTPDLDAWPTNIVVDHADILERNAAVHIGADSFGSGVRNSLLHLGASASAPSDCTRIDADASGRVRRQQQLRRLTRDDGPRRGRTRSAARCSRGISFHSMPTPTEGA